MTAVRSAIFSTLFILWTLTLGLLYVPLLLVPRGVTVVAARLWLHGAFGLLALLCGLRWQVRGTVPQGAALIASKHQSTLETYAFRLIFADPAVILKKELLRIPIFGWYLWKTGVIAIDRSAGTRALKDMVRGAEAARDQGRPVLIFPEGTRSQVGQAGQYHTGIAMIYTSLGLPCVPVAVNSGLFWPRGSMTKHPGTVIIEFLDPIPPGLDRRKFMAELEKRIEDGTNALVAEARAADPSLPQGEK